MNTQKYFKYFEFLKILLIHENKYTQNAQFSRLTKTNALTVGIDKCFSNEAISDKHDAAVSSMKEYYKLSPLQVQTHPDYSVHLKLSLTR